VKAKGTLRNREIYATSESLISSSFFGLTVFFAELNFHPAGLFLDSLEFSMSSRELGDITARDGIRGTALGWMET
jgi:hypothetical protein